MQARVNDVRSMLLLTELPGTRSSNRELARWKEENEELRARLAEAEQTLDAIRSGEVDALVVNGPHGEQIFTLQSADQPYRVLIETMSEAALTLSFTGDILYCNGRTAKMLQRSSSYVIGSPLTSYVDPSDAASFRRLIKRARNNLTKAEIRFRIGNGKTIPGLVSMTKLDANGASALCVVIADLSEIVAAREKLRQANEDLESRVHERTASLAKANAALRRARGELEVRVRERTAELTRANKDLKQQIEERLRSEKELSKVQREVAETSDREQLRLGQELHDGLQQELTGIAYLVDVIELDLARSAPSLCPQVRNVKNKLLQSVEHARDVAKEFYPVHVERNGLFAALEEMAKKKEASFGIECRVRAVESCKMLRGSLAVQLFRIAQEAVQNAIKHGHAKQIKVSLTSNRSALILTVEDNGTGLPAGFKASQGMGFRIMKYRTRMIGARLNTGNAVPHGFTVSCQVPKSVLHREQNGQ